MAFLSSVQVQKFSSLDNNITIIQKYFLFNSTRIATGVIRKNADFLFA